MMCVQIHRFYISFTDPIPPGIMEEACDWDVIIEPPSKPTHKIPDVPKPEKKKKQAKAEQTTSKPCGESHISAVITERATGDKSYRGSENKAKNHSPKPERQKPLPPATNLQRDSNPTRREQNDTLPRIPPLSSFKLHAQKVMTFNEAVADYETFITEGLGRSVEFIHQYDDFNRSQDAVNGLHNSHDNNEAYKSYVVEESQSYQDLPPPQENSELSPEQKTASVSSDDSSSESEMEVESESSSSVPNRSSHHTIALPDSHVHNRPESNESSLSSARVSQQSSGHKQRPSKPQSQNPARHHSPPQNHRATSKSSRKAASAGQKRRKDETDELEEEVAGQDYWSSYRAWVEYYNSYYHHSPYNWMTAFYMNSVYMNEMMKH